MRRGVEEVLMQQLRALISSWGHDRLANPGEAALASRVSGVLWLSGAVTLLLTLALPGSTIDSLWAVAVIAAFAVAWGTLMLSRLAWSHWPVRLSHISAILSLCVVAALTGVTGGTDSPALDYLWFVVVYAAFFYTPRQAVAYWLACGVVHALPLLYDGRAIQGNLARELVVVVPIYCLVGGVVVAGRELLAGSTRRAGELEARQRRMTEEQASLRRVATAVAAGSPPAGVFALVSLDAGRLLGADCAAIVRFQGADRVTVLGRWTHDDHGPADPDATVKVLPGSLLDRLRRGDAIARDRLDGEYHCMRLAAPVQSGAALWGALIVVATDPHEFADGAEERLHDYADLIATAVANAEDRARLGAEAGTDALTGLPNHRAFRERLTEEVARAQRHDRPLTVALIDVDGFRDLNDRAGLDMADEVLVEIGSLLRAAVREEDVLARMGADEYGVIFVESDRHQALMRADRARRAIAEAPLRHRLRATVSIGLCDLEAASTSEEALRRADAALYWAKEHGCDLCWLYDPTVVRELDQRQRTRDLDRTQALVGLRALARAIDAKDPATQEHSERVATLSARLAAARGWAPERVSLLRDAALLHDVGKIGVPDAILLKDGPLDEEEFAIMREHALLGARIVGDVLEEEQIAWIAGHHERPDGSGYPGALKADEIPEGAALLALADAWDVMVSDRSYSAPMTVEAAVAEACARADAQFTAAAVEALEKLAARGDLMPVAARLHQPTA
ncbi:MAG TPA: diguanylate cyclase [Solirubrobacteraceae bacterium]|nr:diguanylate cyclase [Solirubrobacteraceae bacterium]